MLRYNELVRRADAERSAAIGEMIGIIIAKTWFGVKRLTAAIAAGSVKLREYTADHVATAR